VEKFVDEKVKIMPNTRIVIVIPKVIDVGP
jgi:hypothetical protein